MLKLDIAIVMVVLQAQARETVIDLLIRKSTTKITKEFSDTIKE